MARPDYQAPCRRGPCPWGRLGRASTSGSRLGLLVGSGPSSFFLSQCIPLGMYSFRPGVGPVLRILLRGRLRRPNCKVVSLGTHAER